MLITPSYISSLVNFYSNTGNPDWQFDPAGRDMRNLQVLGAAKVYNLLQQQGIALLADEVGMGKTIQALTVCVALWNHKPDARILILAPRDEIAQNWIKEYQTFIRHHYRHSDNLVKSITGQEPLKKMVYCQNMYRLVHQIQQGWGQLYLSKISSFSSLMSRKDILSRLEELDIRQTSRVRDLQQTRDLALNQAVASLLKKEIQRYASDDQPYFDLLIIDEAHYLRNKEGASLRVNAATEFFGDPLDPRQTPLAKKVMLLTATPNHSSSQDIGKVISYFTNRFEGKTYTQILEKICVRRLRRLSKRGYNKYNYRNEECRESSFQSNPLGEMFFGLYQHELVKEMRRLQSAPGKGQGRQMMKYLEGVEFIPFEPPKEEMLATTEEGQLNSTDFMSGSDAKILEELSRKYYSIFASTPQHPKYNRLVEELTVSHPDEKAVVFVRRIPSVFEISKRVIQSYDTNMWTVLSEHPIGKIPVERVDRKRFNQAMGMVDSEVIEDEDASPADGESNIPSSRVLNLFRVIKHDRNKYTHAANFRLRFNHSKSGVFTLFFSPGQDYFAAPYQDLISYRYEARQDKPENFFQSALLHRTKRLEPAIAKDIESKLLTRNPLPDGSDTKRVAIPTLLTLYWALLRTDDRIDGIDREKIQSAYLELTAYEKEALSLFLEKGVLLASAGLVWLYRCFLVAERSAPDNSLQLYLSFAETVKKGLQEQRMYHQIGESILHFRQIYTKEFSINGSKELLEETWDSFNNAQPIYPYNADNSSKKILRCFNTPFFPDILVATSVLQEGVNLQYFCNKIYHYGMAWTPGDNEQRIGRVDRMFGKIERLLEEDEHASLQIFYPYLKDSIDEEQLARFVKRKFKEEQLIDLGLSFEENSGFQSEDNDNDSWKAFFRKPEKRDILDPFPVNPESFTGIQTALPTIRSYSLDPFLTSIVSAINGLDHLRPEIFSVDTGQDKRILIDPFLENGRKQPVIMELVYDHIGSGYLKRTVYCMRMRTPLAPYIKYRQVRGVFTAGGLMSEVYRPGIRLCLDISQPAGSHWGLYMSYDLPLFMEDLSVNPLSEEEVQDAFQSLVYCADMLEASIFGRDLQKEELNLPVALLAVRDQVKLRKAKAQAVGGRWKQRGDYYLQEQPISWAKDIFDKEKQALILNHQTLYVKTFLAGAEWMSQVSVLASDAYKLELELLEKHQDVFRRSQVSI